jgi:DHA1 family tetracycline resistance protein-like MFS transporter
MPLYLVIFVAFIGYSMMVTLFVPMLMHPNGFLDETVVRSTRTIYVGILLALYPLGQFIGAPAIGSFSDRYGRKRVLSISLFVTIFFYILIAYSLQIQLLWLLMASCFFCGLSESNVAIAQSAIADASRPEDRGRLFAYLYAAMSFGYIMGPLVGGQIAVHYGFAPPFWIVIGLLVITYIWILLSFHDTYKPKTDEPIDYFKAFTNLAAVFTDLPIRRVYLVNFLLFLSTYGFWRVIQIYMVDKWNFDVGQVTFYYSYLAVVSAIANMFIFAPLSKKLGLKWLIIGTAVVGGLFMLSIIVPESPVSYWFTAGPTSLVLVMTVAGCGAYLSTLVGPERQGRVLGNNLALQVGAESMSALIGGFLAAILIPLPLIVYGVITILGGLLLITYRKKGEAGSETGKCG